MRKDPNAHRLSRVLCGGNRHISYSYISKINVWIQCFLEAFYRWPSCPCSCLPIFVFVLHGRWFTQLVSSLQYSKRIQQKEQQGGLAITFLYLSEEEKQRKKGSAWNSGLKSELLLATLIFKVFLIVKTQKFLRINQDTSNELLKMASPMITKKNTVMCQNAISDSVHLHHFNCFRKLYRRLVEGYTRL